MRRDHTGSPSGARVRAAVVVAVAFAGVMCIASLQGLPVFGTFPGIEPAALPAAESQTALPIDSAPPVPPEPNPWLGIIAGLIGAIIAVLFAIFLIRVLVRLIRDRWRARPLARVEGTAPGAEADVLAVEETVDAPIVRRGIAGALDAVDATADPGDAIVAAWLGLEQSAERAGHTRGAAETAAEFTVRIVAARRSSAGDIRALLRLYENVRFGGIAATERERGIARELLRSIEEHWR
ncbi:DUF4129 domain-containing protein [Microbacterium tumbae]